MKNILKIAILFIVTVSFLGCTTIRTYPGDPLPKDEVSILKGAWNEYFFTRVIGITYKVDGKKLETSSKVEILPGEHEVSAYLTKTYNLAQALTLSGKLKTFKIDTKAGHTYIIDGNWNGGNNQIWIEDKNTGVIVAGNKPD